MAGPLAQPKAEESIVQDEHIGGPPVGHVPQDQQPRGEAIPCPELGHVFAWLCALTSRWLVGHTLSHQVVEVKLETGDPPEQ
eukprot:15496450-Heterocapsa_arctica.AAC.1